MTAGRAAGAEPQSRQLLRRNRAGGVLRRPRGARASTSPTTRCSPDASTPTSTRRFRGWAAPTSTRSRSTRRWRRCTTTSAMACTGRPSIAAGWPTSRTRSAAAARSRPARPDSCRSPSRVSADDHKVRGKAERFADHYTQATLFWNSQTAVEKRHIVNAFRFELSKVQTPAIRERMVSGLMNVDAALAKAVAAGLGIREMPDADAQGAPEGHQAGGLRVAGVVAVRAAGRRRHPQPPHRHSRRRRHATARAVLGRAADAEGAVPRFVGPRSGRCSLPASDRHRGGHRRRRALGAVRRGGVAGRR